MKVYPVYFILVLILISNASANADLGYPIKLGQNVNLIQICDNCTYVNVTTLKYPNSSIIYINTLMSQNGNTYSLKLNSSFAEDIGIYTYTTCGDLNGQNNCQSIDFEVSKLGAPLNLQKTILYILIFLFSIGLFLSLIFVGIKLPYNNSSDATTGYILAVNNLKYLKIFLFGIAYIALIGILYFGYVISYSFLDMEFVGNILYFCFYGSLALLLPLFIVGTYVLIANWIRDNQIADSLSRGLRIR